MQREQGLASKVARLEKDCEQRDFLIFIMMLLLIVETAALLILWNQQGAPDFDHIGVSLTVFQTLFGVGALYGFWALRGLTKERAEFVAEAEIHELAPPLIRRMVAEYLETQSAEAPISDDDVDRLVDAIGDGPKEAKDG